MKFQLRSSAKVNLTLDILNRRPDGYHELASIVHTVGLWDSIQLEVLQDGPLFFSCNRAELAGEDNLCVRAVKKWNAATGENQGARIHLDKRIPTGAGLGGGSGNAAAILLGLNRASHQPLPIEQLREMGASLGADVPLFLEGGAVLMEGIGEKLTPLSPMSGWLLIIKPQESFPTPAIYRAWDGENRKSVRATANMLAEWSGASLKNIAPIMGNDLQFAAQSLSDLPRLCNTLLSQSDALGAQLSGSGSACFGLYESEAQAQRAAEKVQRELAKDVQVQNSRLYVASFCEVGVEVAP